MPLIYLPDMLDLNATTWFNNKRASARAFLALGRQTFNNYMTILLARSIQESD